jgi:hypothetical protein
MTRVPNNSKLDYSHGARRPPRRLVRILAYFLLTVVCLAIPILLLLPYHILQDEKQAGYATYPELLKFDPSREGGHLAPNLDVLAATEHKGRAARWITNSKGFRNSTEFAYQVPGGTFRILFMGDSYVDGLRTDQEQTIGYGLERRLTSGACKLGFPNYQVMISGHNNPAAALYNYQEHGWKYNSQLVILGITVGNDITPRSYKKSLWPDRDPSEDADFKLIVSDRPRPADQSGWHDLYLPDDAFVEKAPLPDYFSDIEFEIRQDLAKNLPGVGPLLPPVIGKSPYKRYRVLAGGNLTSLGLFYDPLLPEVAGWFRDLEDIILAMNAQVVSNGAKLLVIVFPTRAQVDARDWRLLERFYSLDGTKFRLDYPETRMRGFCQIKGIDCLDLLSGFKAFVDREGAHLYMKRGDMHFNEAGQALAADTISDHICSSTATMLMR